MPAQERLHVGTTSVENGPEVGDCSAATNDRVVLASVFYSVEDIGEMSGRLGRSDIWHV